MRAIVTPALIALALLAPAIARADAPAPGAGEPARRAIELDAYGGAVRRGDLTVTDDASTRNGGAALAFGAHYRSRYFLTPFVDAAYYSLAASDRVVDLGRGPGYVLNRSWIFGLTGGLAFDVWRVRLRAGLGAYDLYVRTVTPGARSTVSEIDFGYVAGASVYPLVRGRFRVGIEARVGLVVEAQTGFLSLGATIGGDAISF